MKPPLGRIAYAPGTLETKTVVGTSSGDADATNLVVTFTAPSSGTVRVVQEGYAFSAGTGPDQVHGRWNVREGTSDIFPLQRMHRTIGKTLHHLSRVVTGLTPGNSYTWKWGMGSSSATIGSSLECQTDRPAVFEVWEVESGDVLGLAQYAPADETTLQCTGTTFADFDATNLAVTFTAPASGEVVVEFEGYASVRQRWTPREGTTNLFAEGKQVLQDSAPNRVTTRFHLTGVTAGSHTYKWGGARIEAGSGNLFCGPDTGSANMRVYAVDTGEMLGFLSTTGEDSGHIINNETSVMEDCGLFFNPGGPMADPLEVTFTVPASGKVYALLHSDAHTEVATTRWGHWGFKNGDDTITGTRRRITDGGLNRKRRMIQSQYVTGLTPGEVTWKWGMEGTGQDHFRMNCADVAPQEMEVWAITEPAAASSRRGAHRTASVGSSLTTGGS